jgi:hypothetical protein
MKYNVGDKVRIKSLDWYNENKAEFDIVPCKGGAFVNPMTLYCDSILTIIDKTDNCYWVKENAFSWTDEMIEGLVEEESTNYSKVIDNGVSNPIIAKTSSATIDTDKGFYSYSDSDGNLEMEWNLPQGYQFVDENGNVINATKIALEKKKKEYPKTYEECCKVLNLPVRDLDILDNMLDATEIIYRKNLDRLLNSFRKLLICRDAYWKLYGEEMGLGKPWEPDWKNDEQFKYVIICRRNCVIKDTFTAKDVILAFPTAEMRDAFYENFKELIEMCKELL